MGKHFGEKIIGQVLIMKEQGMTHRAIAEEFGLTKEQIKELVKRYYRKKRSPVVVPKRRGRPRTRPIRITYSASSNLRWKFNCTGLFFKLLEGCEARN